MPEHLILSRVRYPALLDFPLSPYIASSPAYYVAAVTSLFESIALIVDQHQPIVEKYYGQGKMIPVVRQLMQECDHVVSKTVSGWEEERQVQRKVGEPYFVV